VAGCGSIEPGYVSPTSRPARLAKSLRGARATRRGKPTSATPFSRVEAPQSSVRHKLCGTLGKRVQFDEWLERFIQPSEEDGESVGGGLLWETVVLDRKRVREELAEQGKSDHRGPANLVRLIDCARQIAQRAKVTYNMTKEATRLTKQDVGSGYGNGVEDSQDRVNPVDPRKRHRRL